MTDWTYQIGNLRLGRLALAVLLVAAFVCFAIAQSGGGETIFAMADIHGDFESATALLRRVGILDETNRWSGLDATFVQMGDFTDRGPEVRSVMDLLISMEDDAPNGRVIILLGNHEIMNMVGELGDVTADNYTSFVDSASERRRRSAFEEYVDFRQRRAQRLGLPESEWSPQLEEEWMEAHPLGFVEHRQAFSPDGRYGRWLRRHSAVTKVGDTVFVHGGIHPSLIALSLEDINVRVRDELEAFDRSLQFLVEQQIALPFLTLEELVTFVREELDVLRREISEREAEAVRRGRPYESPDSERLELRMLEGMLSMGAWMILHPDGVLWFRGFAEWTEEEGVAHVEQLLARHEAGRFVVGHTPQLAGQVQARFEGRVFLADTGMLASFYPGGRGSILEIGRGTVRALYLDGEVVLSSP